MPASRLARFGLKPSRLCFGMAAALLVAILGWPALAKTDAALCDQAASVAARKHGVPLDVLRTVALLETGHAQGGQMRPWPWALNAGGQSHWLPSKAEAVTKARAILATGRRNLDFGCFQLNYHWHGTHFASVEDMLDPAQNADYAARYLLGHYRRLGDWKAAVGAYHSRTAEYAQRYLARYDALAQALAPLPAPQRQTTAPSSTNGYALLTGHGGGTRGSLVPASVLSGTQPLLPLLERAP
ncbi:MAG: transglycosylase SLT domain-containing protein [Rhodobacteraceae bacterium]|nr:transglycosylase SLT domain-containing protein [Paracoccaceae bacterium]